MTMREREVPYDSEPPFTIIVESKTVTQWLLWTVGSGLARHGAPLLSVRSALIQFEQIPFRKSRGAGAIFHSATQVHDGAGCDDAVVQ